MKSLVESERLMKVSPYNEEVDGASSLSGINSTKILKKLRNK